MREPTVMEKKVSIMEKGRAWVCPACATRYPGDQIECVVCPAFASVKP